MVKKRFLGIDIGGTTAKYAIISQDGEISRPGSFATGAGRGLQPFLETLFQAVDGAIPENISGIGLCCPGIVNSGTGEIMGGVDNMPYLQGINLKGLLSERYPGIPVLVSNDVKAVARGERWMGAARGCKSFFCAALGTGLGGALVIDSRVVEGSHFRAGEVCYLYYRNNNDYYEKRVSTSAVMKQAADRLGLPEIDGIEFFKRARMGDKACLELLDCWMEELSRMFADLVVILDIEKIIIGGGISSEWELLLPRIRSAVDRRLPPGMRGQTCIEAARCANNAGMLGAVSLFLNIT